MAAMWVKLLKNYGSPSPPLEGRHEFAYKAFPKGWVLYKKLSTVFDEIPKKINYMIICAKGIPVEKANHNLGKQ
jgi:hypothetical protein